MKDLIIITNQADKEYLFRFCVQNNDFKKKPRVNVVPNIDQRKNRPLLRAMINIYTDYTFKMVKLSP